ncbi:unnamed protein product [Urochloa decumbens]|uniref:Uncharacterized protein n=1 Tax=Urochloa decumbens TaxID=240449 RepID=A0ABC8WIS8_9POAL
MPGAFELHIIGSHLSPDKREKFWRLVTAFGILNIGFALLICAVVLAAGVGPVGSKATACISFLYWPLIPIGLVLMGSCCCACAGLNRLYLVFVCIAILALVASTVFSSVAVGGLTLAGHKDDDKVDPAREYNLSDYRGWLRDRLAEPRYWATVSACLRDRRHACKGMGHLVRDPNSGLLVPDHGPGGLPPIQSGCCKPPSSCAFTYVNRTAAAAADTDCSRWSDDRQILCFQCDSCKAGVLQDIKRSWTVFAIIIICLMLFPVCCLPCLVCLYAEDDDDD